MHACDRTRRGQQHLWDLGTTEVLVRRTTHCVARAQLLVYSEAKRYHNTSTEVEAMLDSSSVPKKKKSTLYEIHTPMLLGVFVYKDTLPADEDEDEGARAIHTPRTILIIHMMT